MSGVFKKILKIIFPPKCLICGKIIENDNSFCCECWKKIAPIEKPYCSKCSTPLDFKVSDSDLCGSCLKNNYSFIKSRSAFAYNNIISKVVFKYKFYDDISLAKFMSHKMVHASRDIIDNIDMLVVVPMHKKRLIFRKYNQALLLANEISKITLKPVINDFLIKTKHTTPQAKLKQKNRKTNVVNTFSINKKYLNDIDSYINIRFAIVDDVMTTGSTLNECTKALNKVGINNVYVITFAKTVMK